MILLGLRAPKFSKKRKPLLFYPSDWWKQIGWDILVSMLLFITCFTTPINIAFQEEISVIDWYMKTNYVIDILFFIDILVIFNTAVYNDY